MIWDLGEKKELENGASCPDMGNEEGGGAVYGDGNVWGEVWVGRGKSSLMVEMNNHGDQMSIIEANVYGVTTMRKHSTSTNSLDSATTLRNKVPWFPYFTEDETKKQGDWEMCQNQ